MLDKQIITFNLFNAVEHIVESMMFLDFLLANDNDESRQEVYKDVMYNIRISGERLCDLGDFLVGNKIDLSNIDIGKLQDQQVIDYIDKIQERIKVKKEQQTEDK